MMRTLVVLVAIGLAGLRTLVVLVAIGLAGCGGGGSAKSDAPKDTAGSGAAVQSVSCTGLTPDATVTTSGTAYSPMATTINAGQVVQFVMPNGSNHNVTSTTPGLTVDFNATACLKFAAAGSYSFKCSVHGFTGSITVH